MNSENTCVEAFAMAVERLADDDSRIVVVVNDSVSSSGLRQFQQRFPDRIVNVGIAEQNMVSIAAGLAYSGKIPVVSSAAAFLVNRAMEQIKIDVALPANRVVLVGQSPGVSYGPLGATHHAVEDLALMRVVPDLTVLSPHGPAETFAATRWAVRHGGPVYLRVPRMSPMAWREECAEFRPGVAIELRSGRDMTIIATGAAVGIALDAGTALAYRGVEARVLQMPSVKPLDTGAVVAAARETRGIVTVEDALTSGLGGAVAELVTERHPCRVIRLGFRDTFAVSGPVEHIWRSHGLDVPAVVAAALLVIDGVG